MISPHEAQKQADRQAEADPNGPEVAEDAVSDVIVEDADRRHGGREQQLDGQDAVNLANEAFIQHMCTSCHR